MVEKIEVVKSRYILGDYGFSGIINILTSRGDVGNITLPEDVSRLRYRAYEIQDKFSYPDYSPAVNRNSHIPDFRNTMYWNTLTVSATGQSINLIFPASDYLSDYEIVIQGRTKNGRSVSERGMIRITR